MKPQGSAKGQQEGKIERGGITAQNKQNVYNNSLLKHSLGLPGTAVRGCMFKFANIQVCMCYSCIKMSQHDCALL